ncbi:MAG: hypothetical protein B7Y80_20740 [Hyphomicrobium sp. 32-62-53]|jgi:hypothetical protein|nr:MAG: hypothetical protein B7Y80_20740 [Hyphomicrobium sp. 32-62-53]
MLNNTDIPGTDGIHGDPSPARCVPAPLPRLCSIRRTCAEWGDCGKTRFYEIAREHGVDLLKIGSKTVVSGEDVGRVADAILSAARKAAIDARALAEKSVAARRERRGSALAASHSRTAARRRRRSNSTG